MKIRNGFVSNSSSSSFVIHKSTVKDWKGLVQELYDLEEKDKTEQGKDRVQWGEDYYTFEVDKNFLRVQYNWKIEAYNIVKKYVDLNDILMLE